MFIVGAMARNASAWESGVAFVDVTVFASYTLVLTFQGKFGARMVEEKLLPTRFFMADVALLAELAFMRFVVLMAVVTFALRFAKFFLRHMASRASDLLVLAFELKIGGVVIEGVFIEQHYVRFASLMFSMASLAGLVFRISNASVETFFIGDIGANFFVTIIA